MLRENFPSSNEGAKVYDGFMENTQTFVKAFSVKDTLEDTLKEVNDFLGSNGYECIDTIDLDKDFSFESYPINLGAHSFKEELILHIERDSYSKTQTEFLVEQLKKFRDKRNWGQFHNSKDLAIALNIESSELLEVFLWKKHDDADLDKVKEELADVFSYALLLANKYDFNVEEIVLEKIKKNAMKYPVDKAKGNAKKYNEFNL